VIEADSKQVSPSASAAGLAAAFVFVSFAFATSGDLSSVFRDLVRWSLLGKP